MAACIPIRRLGRGTKETLHTAAPQSNPERCVPPSSCNVLLASPLRTWWLNPHECVPRDEHGFTPEHQVLFLLCTDLPAKHTHTHTHTPNMLNPNRACRATSFHFSVRQRSAAQDN